MSELYHYGRKGMKWGQHIFGKDGNTSGKKQRETRKEESTSSDGEKRFHGYNTYREYIRSLSPQELAKVRARDSEISKRAESHSMASMKASRNALTKHQAGEDPKLVNRDLNDARKLLKKAELTAKELSNPDDFLHTDAYLEPKWTYEDAHDRIRSDRGEKFVRKFSG